MGGICLRFVGGEPCCLQVIGREGNSDGCGTQAFSRLQRGGQSSIWDERGNGVDGG